MDSYQHGIDITLVLHGPTTVVTLAGNLDTLTADDVLISLQAEITNGRAQLVGDLSGVEYTSSAGLRALLAATKEARQRGGDLRLAAATERVHKVLDLSGFTSILRTFPDVEAAVASFS